MSMIKLGETKDAIKSSITWPDFKEGRNKVNKEYLVYDFQADLKPVTLIYFFDDTGHCNLVRCSYKIERQKEIIEFELRRKGISCVEDQKIWKDESQNLRYTKSYGEIDEAPYSENLTSFNIDIQTY